MWGLTDLMSPPDVASCLQGHPSLSTICHDSVSISIIAWRATHLLGDRIIQLSPMQDRDRS